MNNDNHDTALYLMPESETDIKLDDNSITLWQNEQLVTRYPLRRIQFICTNTQANWHIKTLGALLEKGISLHIIDKNNQTLGKLLPTSKPNTDDYHWIDRLLHHPNWQQLVENYTQAQAHKNLKKMLARHGAWLPSLSQYEVNRWLEEQYRKAGSKGSHKHRHAYCQSLFMAKISQQLHDNHMPQSSTLLANMGFDLASIIGNNYQYRIHEQLILWYSSTRQIERENTNLTQLASELSQQLSDNLPKDIICFINWIKATLD
jgi:hypothetical protein